MISWTVKTSLCILISCMLDRSSSKINIINFKVSESRSQIFTYMRSRIFTITIKKIKFIRIWLHLDHFNNIHKQKRTCLVIYTRYLCSCASLVYCFVVEGLYFDLMIPNYYHLPPASLLWPFPTSPHKTQ